jgi:hypothetical protein
MGIGAVLLAPMRTERIRRADFLDRLLLVVPRFEVNGMLVDSRRSTHGNNARSAASSVTSMTIVFPYLPVSASRAHRAERVNQPDDGALVFFRQGGHLLESLPQPPAVRVAV